MTDSLLDRLREREPAAFREALARYAGPLHRTLTALLGDRDEAEDLVQEAFAQLFLKIDSVRSLRPWLYGVALNFARMRLRRKRPGPLPEAHPVDAPREGSDLRERVDRALAGLSDTLRTTFLLREAAGLTTQEVADVEGCSPDAVRHRLSEARRKLREALGPRFQESLK